MKAPPCVVCVDKGFVYFLRVRSLVLITAVVAFATAELFWRISWFRSTFHNVAGVVPGPMEARIARDVVKNSFGEAPDIVSVEIYPLQFGLFVKKTDRQRLDSVVM